MIFDKQAQLLQLSQTSAGVFEWEPVKTIPVKMEPQTKTNLFSKVGIGAKTMLFTLRKTAGIRLFCAFRVSGQFYFLTDIQQEGGILLKITAAVIEPITCCLLRRSETLDAYKRPVYGQPQPVLTFPAILTEKYLGFVQREPMAQTEKTFVLVTPKAFALETGDLMEIGEKRYAVQVCHMLDEYKNEYEITRKEDA